MAGERGRRGEWALAFSALFFSLTALAVKSMSLAFSGPAIAFARFTVELLLCILIIIMSKKGFAVKEPGVWLLRGFFGAGSMVLYFVAINATSSGRATLLFNTYPVFVALAGAMFFHRRIEARHILSLLLCAAGVAGVFYDGSSYPLSGDAAGLLSGMMAGVAIHYVQKSRRRNSTPVVYGSAVLFGLLFTAPQALTGVFPWRESLMPLALIGVLSLASQLSMTYGFKYVHPTTGSIIAYSSLPLTLFASYIMGETFSPRFFLGTAFIVAGLIVNLSKNKKGKDETF